LHICCAKRSSTLHVLRRWSTTTPAYSEFPESLATCGGLHDAATTNPDAGLAVRMFSYSIRKQVAAVATALGGVGLLVFTGGIGENDAKARAGICDGLFWLGVNCDPASDRAFDGSLGGQASRCSVRVLPRRKTRRSPFIRGRSPPARRLAACHESQLEDTASDVGRFTRFSDGNRSQASYVLRDEAFLVIARCTLKGALLGACPERGDQGKPHLPPANRTWRRRNEIGLRNNRLGKSHVGFSLQAGAGRSPGRAFTR
jgi:hypothetical protein